MHNTIGVVTRSPTAIHSVYYSATLILNQINIWAFQKIKQRVLPVASKKPVHQQQPSHCQRDESQWLQAMPMPTKRVFPIHLQKSLFHKKKCTSLTVLLNSIADTQKSCSASQQLFPLIWQHAANFRGVWHFWRRAQQLQKYSEYSWVYIEGVFFIMLVGWIMHLFRNNFNKKLLKFNTEDKSHFTQAGKPKRGSACQNWPPLCTISHILQTSPKSWGAILHR